MKSHTLGFVGCGRGNGGNRPVEAGENQCLPRDRAVQESGHVRPRLLAILVRRRRRHGRLGRIFRWSAI